MMSDCRSCVDDCACTSRADTRGRRASAPGVLGNSSANGARAVPRDNGTPEISRAASAGSIACYGPVEAEEAEAQHAKHPRLAAGTLAGHGDAQMCDQAMDAVRHGPPTNVFDTLCAGWTRPHDEHAYRCTAETAPPCDPELAVAATEERAGRPGAFRAWARDERRAREVGCGLARVLRSAWARRGAQAAAAGLRWLFSGWHMGAIVVALDAAMGCQCAAREPCDCGESDCASACDGRCTRDVSVEWRADVLAALASDWRAEHVARLLLLLRGMRVAGARAGVEWAHAGCGRGNASECGAHSGQGRETYGVLEDAVLHRLDRRAALLVAAHVARLSRS